MQEQIFLQLQGHQSVLVKYSFYKEKSLQAIIMMCSFSHGHRQRRAVSFRLSLTEEEEE